MGLLLSKLGSDTKMAVDIILDFDAAPKSDEERAIHQEISDVLAQGPQILEELQSYTGCEEYIRKAITTPGQETEEAAWNAVLPAVEQLKTFYDFSLRLEACFPKLLTQLCKGSVSESMKDQEALAKLLADVFDFVLRFDDAKMVNPAIQNDFSYYRRTLNRMKLANKDATITIKDELANKMSLFFAYPTPMMKLLSQTTAKFLADGQGGVPNDAVTEALAVMANICQHMVEAKTFDTDNLNLFCMRAMTGAIILYDHVADAGAFHKKSPVNVRGAVTVLKGFQPSSGANPADSMLNALRFTTVHYNDADTPGNIKQLLG